MFAANHNVQAFFVLEDGIRQQVGKKGPKCGQGHADAPLESPRPAQGKLQRMMLKGLGSLKADRAKKNIYHVAEGSSQVRKTIAVDNYFESEICHERSTYVSTVQPLVQELFDEEYGHDSVVMTYGPSATSKMKLLHGNTLDPEHEGEKFPPQNSWGLIHYALQEMIPLAEKHLYKLHCTAVRVQIDSVVDGLVSPGSLRQHEQIDEKAVVKLRSQFQRLLALTNASALDIDSDADGRIVMADQVSIHMTKMDDFLHIVNCFAAANTARILAKLSATSGGGSGAAPATATPALRTSPFNYIITFRLTDALNPNRNRTIHFAELADVDWTTQVPEDMRDFEQSFDCIVQSLHIIATSNPTDEAEGQLQLGVYRNSMSSKILFTQVRSVGLKVALFSHARYSQSIPAMEFIAKARNNLIGIVLHGPDREGENEVDPELREHIAEIQKECDTLKVEIDALLLEKRRIVSKIQSGDETMARLEQRRATLQRMTVASFRPVKNNDDELHQQRHQQELMARITHQQNCLRLEVLEREIEDLAKEEENREMAAKRQLKFINDEKERIQAKVVVLQKECDALALQGKKQQIEFEKEKQAIFADGQRQLSQVLERNRGYTEKVNAALRKGLDEENEAAKKQAQRLVEKEQANDMAMSVAASRNETINSTLVDPATAVEVKQLEGTLTELREKRQLLERERVVMSTEHKRQLEMLDSQAAVLGEYAFKMSSVLASIEKRVPAAKLLRIPAFEPGTKHKTEWLTSRCHLMQAWLAKNGGGGGKQPAYVVDPIKGTLKETNAPAVPTPVAATAGPTTSGDIAASTNNNRRASQGTSKQAGQPEGAATPARLTVSQLRSRLATDISRHNHQVQIAHSSQQRLRDMHASS